VQPGSNQAFEIRARGDFYARYNEFWRRAVARAWYARRARAFFFKPDDPWGFFIIIFLK
jgi:hypothetical protein